MLDYWSCVGGASGEPHWVLVSDQLGDEDAAEFVVGLHDKDRATAGHRLLPARLDFDSVGQQTAKAIARLRRTL
jgi:hypothetical protein